MLHSPLAQEVLPADHVRAQVAQGDNTEIPQAWGCAHGWGCSQASLVSSVSDMPGCHRNFALAQCSHINHVVGGS